MCLVEIDHESGVPRYWQLADWLRAPIERGDLTGRIPGEQHLTQETGPSQSSVRRALGLLHEQGLIITTPGWAASSPGRTGRAAAGRACSTWTPLGWWCRLT